MSQAQQQCADKEAERVQLLERAKDKQAALEAAEALAQTRLQEIAAAEQAHEHTKGQLAAAQKDLQTLNSERDELLQQQGSTSAAAANLHAKVQELQTRVAQLQAQVDGGQQEAGMLKQQLAAQSGALRALQEQHSSSTQELAVLREQANKLRSDKVHLEIREAEQSATITQLKDDLHQLRQQADAARKDCSSAQRAADDAARDAVAAAAHAKVTEAQLAALTVQQQQVQSALEQRAAEAAAASARAAEAAGRAVQLEEQLTEVRRELSAAQRLAERHAGEAAVGIAKMKSAEALCFQLQEDNRKQVSSCDSTGFLDQGVMQSTGSCVFAPCPYSVAKRSYGCTHVVLSLSACFMATWICVDQLVRLFLITLACEELLTLLPLHACSPCKSRRRSSTTTSYKHSWSGCRQRSAQQQLLRKLQ
jgi:predicted  nucleic acid-binding Zn-ribbon protein